MPSLTGLVVMNRMDEDVEHGEEEEDVEYEEEGDE